MKRHRWCSWGLGLVGISVCAALSLPSCSGISAVPADSTKAAASVPKIVRVSPQDVDASDPIWSPKGDKLAFTVWHTTKTGPTGGIQQAVGSRVISISGRPLARLSATHVTWCSNDAVLWENGKVRETDIRTGRTRASAIKGAGPECSPDGSKVAVQQGTPPNARLVVVNRRGRRIAVLARTARYFEYFTYEWSPSGRYLAVAYWKPHGFGSRLAWLRIFTPEGRLVRELPRQIRGSAEGGFVSWSPDEENMVYGARSADGCTLYRLALRGSDPPVVLAHLDGSDVWGVRMSRDGRRIVYTMGTPAVEDLRPRYGAIYLLDMSTERTTRLVRQAPWQDGSGYGAVWSPDGEHLAYAAEGAIYLVTLPQRR